LPMVPTAVESADEPGCALAGERVFPTGCA
jgi:hypothetical protein